MVFVRRADVPLAVFRAPVVLLKSANAPVAVFSSEALNRSVPAPTPVLNWLVALPLSERKPTAVLNPPVIRVRSAFCPSAVFPPGYLHRAAGRLHVPALEARNSQIRGRKKRKQGATPSGRPTLLSLGLSYFIIVRLRC